MLDPDAVAAATFGTSRKGYDPAEVRQLLSEVAAELRARADADAFAAELLRQAHEDVERLQAELDEERNRAFAAGEPGRAIVDEARAEATLLLAEAEAARARVLGDLARRRKEMRTQVEQLHAAREELLRALADVSSIADQARARLVVALPEAKLASDAAARRVQGEEDVTVAQLEAEIETFRLAGLALARADEAAEAPAVVEAEPEVVEAEVVEPEPVEAVEAARPTVRVFRAGTATPEPEPEPEPVALTTETVDALFARLRAGREARTAEAEAVLADPEPDPEPEPEPEPVVVEDVAVHVGGGPDRPVLLARRDELLAGPTAALTSRLKRLLADEQNTVLDAIRRGGEPVAGDLGAWAAAAVPDLASAAVAGAAFVDHDGAAAPDVADVADELAAATAGQLAEHVAAAVRRADGDAELAADAVRSVCREWRARRLGGAVELAVHAAFGRGALAAVADGAAVCWIVDDGGSPCPDAEDNALAGPVPAGEPFPTGHRHPPAHPGCRCVLAVAEVATAGRR